MHRDRESTVYGVYGVDRDTACKYSWINNRIPPRSHHPHAPGGFLFQPTPGDLQVNPFPRFKRGSHLVIPICSPVVNGYLYKGTRVIPEYSTPYVPSTKNGPSVDSANNEHHHNHNSNLGTVATLNVLFLFLPKRNLLTAGLHGKSVLFFCPVGIQLYQWFCLCPINRCIHSEHSVVNT